MPVTAFPDEWLAQSLEGLTPALLQELRGKSESGKTLWECLVAQKIATDAQIIDKVSHRFRLKVADPSKIDLTARDGVPEQLARRYRVLPLRLTDSYLELGTANPFDLDAEKALAFATAREIRLFLLAPSKISEKLDEIYKPERALDKLLEGMGDAEVLTTLRDTPAPEELNVSEADASQFFFQAEDGIRDLTVTGVQTCALPICPAEDRPRPSHQSDGGDGLHPGDRP